MGKAYTVGRDWPDALYSSNAQWPYQGNQWMFRPPKGTHDGQVSQADYRAAKELEAQKEIKRQIKELKKKLYTAVVEGDVGAARMLIKQHPSLLERHTSFGATALGLAAASGDAPIVSFLLAEGADVTAQDRVGATPLIMAAFQGQTQAAQLILASKQGGNMGKGYLLRQCTRRGETAVMAAAKAGHLDTLKMLVAAGGSVAARDREGLTCLHLAAHQDRFEVCKWLMSSEGGRLSPAALDDAGRTPLMHAAAGGSLQVLQLLLEAQGGLPQAADLLHAVDAQGYGALHHACTGGSVAVVEALAEKGLRVLPNDPSALPLLRLACASGHDGIVAWLLEQGIGLEELTKDGGSHPLFTAVAHGREGVVEALLRFGARLDVRDSRGRTPLARAAAAGLSDMVRLLVMRGADMLVPDNEGRVARKLAYENNHRDTAKVLSGLARRKFLMADDDISEYYSPAAVEEATAEGSP